MKRWTPLVLALALPVSAAAARPDSFSARMVTEMVEAEGGSSISQPIEGGLIYFMKGNSRMEMDMGMMKMIVVHREDQQKSYMINPQKKIYNVVSTAGDKKGPDLGFMKDDPSIVREKLGEETLDGIATTKWKNTHKNPPAGQDALYYTWEAEQFGGLPVQVEQRRNNTTVRMKFTEINQRKVTADLFEIPKDWKEASAPEVMGMPPMPAGMPKMPGMPGMPPQGR